jgi:hypothetical protein
MVKRAAFGAEGFVLDHFSRAAIDAHLAGVATPLLNAFGNQPPYAVFSDSLEVYDSDWTANLPAEFLARRGYDLIPHLPELVAGGTPQAEAVRHDWGRTLSDLIRENYLAPLPALPRSITPASARRPTESPPSRSPMKWFLICRKVKARSGAPSRLLAGPAPPAISMAAT